MSLLFIIGTVICVVSCGSGEDINNEANEENDVIVDGIDVSLLRGSYEFNGNIAPSFILYKDGTCEIMTPTAKGTITEAGEWSYQKQTRVLKVGTYIYTIQMLTTESLVAEWSSIEYEEFTSSWKRSELAEGIDDGTPSKEGQEISTYETLNGHEYVEIGGRKWATMNLGATTISGSPVTCYGDFYAWSETSPRYSGISITKEGFVNFTAWKRGYSQGYTSSISYNKSSLDAEHDAATVNWGPAWHTPTPHDYLALINACTDKSTTYADATWLTTSSPEGGIYWVRLSQKYLLEYSGMEGVLFVDKNNPRKRLFFPAAGGVSGNKFYRYGDYWTFSKRLGGYQSGCTMRISQNGVNIDESCQLSVGLPIRPVSNQ